MSIKTLDTYKVGESGKVSQILPHPLSAKLVEMGFYPGQSLKLLYRAPFGDPIAVEVGDYVLSLRLNEAHLVETEQHNR